MRILHYFLGFPPYRTGGLTKYAYDLMCSQAKNGDKVVALWPGEMGLLCHKPRIVKKKTICNVDSFELINPLPVPLDEGIIETAKFMEECDPKVYRDFLLQIKVDVIHIHTLMGIHKEFLQVANRLKIRIVFTTHDYFGICPKVTLFRNNRTCESDHNCEDCVKCNERALSMNRIWLLQSRLYQHAKDIFFVKMLRRKHRSTFFEEKPSNNVMPTATDSADKYRRLRCYYIEMLSMVDCIHFNSTVTENIYKRYFVPKSYKVMSITHKGIADNRKRNLWAYTGMLRITSLSPAKPFKGYTVLRQALNELWQEGKRDFELKLFSPVTEKEPYMVLEKNGFKYSQISEIMADTDVLVAPSIWYETFGFTVLEALSYGVPVIVSDHVGAKDIIGRCGIIVKAGDKNALKDALCGLNENKLTELRRIINTDFHVRTWEQFLEDNYFLYKNK